MPVYFLDSSALVKRYLEEEGTPRVVEILKQDARFVVSRLAMVEATSAAVRLARGGYISDKLQQDIHLAIEEDFRTLFDVMDLNRPVIIRSVGLVRVHALRAADGIQLASALMAAGASAEDRELIFVSSDNELNAAAEKEDLNVLDPQVSSPR